METTQVKKRTQNKLGNSNLLKELVYVILLASVLMHSCIPDPLEVRGLPTVKPQIVVSSQIIPDESLVILLTKTFGALDASDDSDPADVISQIAVTDAVVAIQSINGIDTLLSLGSGFYGGLQIDLIPGLEYTLHVNSPSLGSVRAKTTVKRQVEFESIEASLYPDGYDDTLAQVAYSFNDLVEKNYYMLNALKINSQSLTENILNPRDYIRLLDDDEFNGTVYSETFRVFPGNYKAGDTLAVYLSNVSKDYYDFIKLRLDNRFSFVEFLGEPVDYPSNVEGGKGFFNLYIPDIEILILEEE